MARHCACFAPPRNRGPDAANQDVAGWQALRELAVLDWDDAGPACPDCELAGLLNVQGCQTVLRRVCVARKAAVRSVASGWLMISGRPNKTLPLTCRR